MAGAYTGYSSIVPGDTDPQETLEWLESFDIVLEANGAERCRNLLQALATHARRVGLRTSLLLNTPYRNTIDVADQPAYPGNRELEKKIGGIIRWNALAMVIRANRESSELGGHLSSYASAADLFEVGFNHFFRGDVAGAGPRTADLVFFQPHSAPGIYARAFLEGRLGEEQLNNFRRETTGYGLPSYPHPWLMPHFWQFPTGSMGLGPLNAIYQARFMRYLHNRSLLDCTGRRVWAFVGDGEMDEPESVAGLALAARENLDNLTFVVNCNLQRLDGPVRGNGSIIQELERIFIGAGWNVIKLLWGSDWDDLFARDATGELLCRFHQTVDGELQSYAANDARFNRDRFFGKTEVLRDLVAHLSDDELGSLTRGGHDPIKIHAAFDAAVRHKGQPTVILAQTKKGYGLGPWAEGRMASHQQKKLNMEALRYFRDRFTLPLSDDDMASAKFYRPPEDSPEIRYMQERRRLCGGFLPARVANGEKLSVPSVELFGRFCDSSGDRELSTTVAFVRILTALLKESSLSSRIVPIVADEARTFGMESLFGKFGIYSHCGQMYEPADQNNVLYYKETQDGQLLEEGITEAGALSSWIAAGTAYSNHGLPMIPFYIYYSIFGFQRVGDLIHAAADSRTRGFLLGATAGRTTLSGEGLQHQDGTSHLIASTVTTCRAYDPCFAYELSVIIEHALLEMYEKEKDVFYYITLMNENYAHLAIPLGAAEGIVRGMYLLRQGCSELAVRPQRSQKTEPARCHGAPSVQLLGSGTILREVISAADLLEAEWGVSATVWSVTSFTELRRDGLEVERANRVSQNRLLRAAWVEECLAQTSGPIIAASDYVRAVPDLIRTWVPGRYVTLGTDGFGRSDVRTSLRRFFEVDRISIAFTALVELVRLGKIDPSQVDKFRGKYDYQSSVYPPWHDAMNEGVR